MENIKITLTKFDKTLIFMFIQYGPMHSNFNAHQPDCSFYV